MLCLGFTPLLVLALGASLVAAVPQHALKKGCGLSKYESLVPHELKPVQKMKSQFDDSMPHSDHKCNIRLFHRRWKAADLSVPDRLKLVEAELDFITKMLGLPAAPGFAEVRQRSLTFFTQAREDLRGCVSAPQKPAGPVLAQRPRCWWQRREAAPVLMQLLSLQMATDQPSGKLRRWLQKLQMAKETETTSCLEASAIIHVFQVLDDLKCAALQEQCS
ncbi:PREDICTED: interferon lambda-3-like [Nipponia nippon]|uniref:interferon lambda-3-like n=1 Tax=Nipponia nippon TaxID=128390 RepID=UPI000510DF9F|nr:PREDICTED: interferon lambda-3-like [Nipponia nippon]